VPGRRCRQSRTPVVINAGGYTLVGYVDKAVQVVLVLALLALVAGRYRD
jgi:hypothetical protein